MKFPPPRSIAHAAISYKTGQPERKCANHTLFKLPRQLRMRF
jgi:hypothetical protein